MFLYFFLYLSHIGLEFINLIFNATKLSNILQTAKRCNNFVYSALLYLFLKNAD